MKSFKVAIVDYGVGNLYSVVRALEYCGARVVLAKDGAGFRGVDAIVLPGVGAFAAGMRGLVERNLIEPISQLATAGKPILGICLGAQLLLSTGEEFGRYKGLGFIPGVVKPFPVLQNNEKIPHIGWNKIIPLAGQSWEGTALAAVTPGSEVYFVHSYILIPEDDKAILATTTYGGYRFCSAVKINNIYGCQFHPEKSGRVGLSIIEKFISELK